MRISEANEKYTAMLRLEEEVKVALPDQLELVGLGSISWGVHWGAQALQGEKLGWRAGLRPEWRGGSALRWSTAFTARVLEVREALQRWERNEGPWPLARTATPERKEP